MDKLEKVELIREKTGVSYDDAKVALEASNDDVLDAIIWLERLGKATAESATYTTTATVEPGPVSPEMAQAQAAYEESAKRNRFQERMQSIFAYLKVLCRKSLDTTFVAERNGERIVALPILFVILGIFLWGATIWLLIIGLFFGFKYHIEGANPFTVDVNDAMDKVADAAENLKRDFTKDE